MTELCDATPTGTYITATPRLFNLSCPDSVEAGGILTAGFVVSGTTSKTVLVRATGPALAVAPLNLSGTMPNPALSLYISIGGEDIVLATNTGLGGDPKIMEVVSAVQEFALNNPTSEDSALPVTQLPGDYRAQVLSVSNTAGTTLVEVYETP